jgi:hypothetical protein
LSEKIFKKGGCPGFLPDSFQDSSKKVGVQDSPGFSRIRLLTIAQVLSISIWIAAITPVASYCRLDKHMKNSFTLYFGMALPFVVWLPILGLLILLEIAF